MGYGSLMPVLLLLIIAAMIAGGIVFASHLLGPRRRTAVKSMPYESGMDPVGDARGRFDVRFYLVALAFLIFDVELLFLYPWAVAAWSEQGGLVSKLALQLTTPGLVFAEIVVFITLLALAFAYAWRKGVFDWRA